MKELFIRMDQRVLAAFVTIAAIITTGTAAEESSTGDHLKFGGEITEEKANFTFTGSITGGGDPSESAIYSSRTISQGYLRSDAYRQRIQLEANLVHGDMKEFALRLRGPGVIVKVTGDNVIDWSVRRDTEANRYLVIRVDPEKQELKKLNALIETLHEIDEFPHTFAPMLFVPVDPKLHEGLLRLNFPDDLAVEIESMANLSKVDPADIAEFKTSDTRPGTPEPLAFRFFATTPSLVLNASWAQPDAYRVVFDKFALKGELDDDLATFVLQGTARVKHPKGGEIHVLGGNAALTSLPDNASYRIEHRPYYYVQKGDTLTAIARRSGVTVSEITEANGFESSKPIQPGQALIIPGPLAAGYHLVFDKPGDYPVELNFAVRVDDRSGWRQMRFTVVPSSLRPVQLAGLPEDTEFRYHGSAQPEREGNLFITHLGATDGLILEWKSSRQEETSRLFYSAETMAQVSIRPGLMSQIHSVGVNVMQGEMNEIEFDVTGIGEVLRITGRDILEWKLSEPDGEKKLVVQFNRSIDSTVQLDIHTQTTLGAFPLSVEPMGFASRDAIRNGGYLRVLNDGSVRLEVTQASGLSQISPDQFPEWHAVNASAQQFAYRFSTTEFNLTVQADNIVPEVSVSQVTVHHIGENETNIDTSLELDIREAPIREFNLAIPSDYVVTRVTTPNLSDYFITPNEDGTANLRIVFIQPVIRQETIQVSMERNQSLQPGLWIVPKITALKAKTARGYLGIATDAGLRLGITTANESLTELGTSFFPKQIPGLQLAWRWRDANWDATINIERVAMFVQADAVHLFSIGEGIANGSSIFNYLITGSPVSTFTFTAPTNYTNLEFTGRDIRSWKLVDGSYEVYLHAPVSGGYTLLATYDRQFDQQGAELNFEGVAPTGVQAEQGYIIVVSDHQFQTSASSVSNELIKLEPGEIPSEHVLLFESPILESYQYLSRPYQLALQLSPFEQGATQDQVVDRADIQTSISAEGQVLTNIKYLLKSKGHSHLRVNIPESSKLWNSVVDGSKVVPVQDADDILIPLPQSGDPNAIITIDLNLATKSNTPDEVAVGLPVVAVPILQTTWNMNAEANHRLQYHSGTLSPLNQPPVITGYSWLISNPGYSARPIGTLALIFGCVLIAALCIRWATREGRRRFDFKSNIGIVLSLSALVIAAVGFFGLLDSLPRSAPAPQQLSFATPFLDADSEVTIELGNVTTAETRPSMWVLWPALLGLVAWAAQLRYKHRFQRKLLVVLGWGLIAAATLRAPNGATAFSMMIPLFLLIHFVWPSILAFIRLPSRNDGPSNPAATAGATALLTLGMFLTSSTADAASNSDPAPLVITSVTQSARVDDDTVNGTVKMEWVALAGQRLSFLYHPAVLTDIQYDSENLTLLEKRSFGGTVYQLTAKSAGSYEMTFGYELKWRSNDGAAGFLLPTAGGLVNQLDLTMVGEDVEIQSASIISQRRMLVQDADGDSTRSRITLSPHDRAFISWNPRTRNTAAEEAVFYGEITHLFIPNAGVIEGIHDIVIRPSRGQLDEIEINVPSPFTITDVQAAFASAWRFDPDSQTLHIPFRSPISSSFAIRVRSQIASEPLPYEQAFGLLSIVGASDEIGTVGIATSADVQLDSATATEMTPINLEDYPNQPLQSAQSNSNELRLRRSFRYESPEGSVTLAARQVEPDVRISTRETLSLGDDRTVLAAQIQTTITRAGIFKLSFELPTGLEVESLSGNAMSHWTELESDGNRIVTIHLRGKTEGQHNFSITLTGPGQIDGSQLSAPKLVIREAAKQQGQLTVVPELGVRLNVNIRDGVTELDPATLGIKQRGVQAFRLLQSDWNLVFDIEQVDPWIQVNSLQDVDVKEGQVQITSFLNYTIENAGVNQLQVRLPVDAESVTFVGQHITDYVQTAETDERLTTWEIKLSRRLVGSYPLRISYKLVGVSQSNQVTLFGIEADNVNLQRGYVTIRANGRLEVRVPDVPQALSATDWQTIPATLRRGESTDANHTFRVVDPSFDLGIQIVRHTIADLLPARVEKVDLNSTLSSKGELLTEAKLWIHPGDKRLLELKLPTESDFWFAFVNGESAMPWMDGDKIMIPLEENAEPSQPALVEFFYTSPVASGGRRFNQQLAGPEFDLPLQNITWTTSISPEWRLSRWDERWQFGGASREQATSSGGLSQYFSIARQRQSARTQQAESLIQKGNRFLADGDQQMARKAYRGAMELSQHDAALNEDARVQLQNLKQQQALVGLNVRLGNAFVEPGTEQVKAPVQLRDGANYTQQQAQQLIQQNTKEENDAFMQLAGKLVQQQEAAQGQREAIRATLPQQEQKLVFTRSLHIDEWAPLELDLKLERSKSSVSPIMKVGLLMGLVIGFAIVLLASASDRKQPIADAGH